MNYDREEKGIRICLNKEELPFDGYFIGSRNYYRRIDDIDGEKAKYQGKNGFALIGGFEDKESTILFEDILYLAVCRENEQKDLYFLFTVKNEEIVLIKESKAQKGAIKVLWKHIEQFLSQRPKKSLQDLFNLIIATERDKHRLQEFSVALHSYAIGHEFDANFTLPKGDKNNDTL